MVESDAKADSVLFSGRVERSVYACPDFLIKVWMDFIYYDPASKQLYFRFIEME